MVIGMDGLEGNASVVEAQWREGPGAWARGAAGQWARQQRKQLAWAGPGSARAQPSERRGQQGDGAAVVAEAETEAEAEAEAEVGAGAGAAVAAEGI